MSWVRVSPQFGLIVRMKALEQRGISKLQVVEAFEVDVPTDQNNELFSFGPSFGQEALDVFVERLMALGLEYFDDFFEFSVVAPEWCEFQARLVPETSLLGLPRPPCCPIHSVHQ